MDRKQRWAAGLMLLSGVSHGLQMVIYGTEDPSLVQASQSGMLFLVVGALLLTGRRWSLWIAATLPLLFGIGALFRIATQDVTWMSYPHALIDFAVVGLAIATLRSSSSRNV